MTKACSSAWATTFAACSPGTPGRRLSCKRRTPRTARRLVSSGMGWATGSPSACRWPAPSLREIHDYAWPDPAWMDVSQIRDEAAGLRPSVRDSRRRLVAVLARRDRLAGHGGTAAEDARRAGAGGRPAAAHCGLLLRSLPADLRRRGRRDRHLLHRQRFRQPVRAPGRPGRCSRASCCRTSGG